MTDAPDWQPRSTALEIEGSIILTRRADSEYTTYLVFSSRRWCDANDTPTEFDEWRHFTGEDLK